MRKRRFLIIIIILVVAGTVVIIQQQQSFKQVEQLERQAIIETRRLQVIAAEKVRQQALEAVRIAETEVQRTNSGFWKQPRRPSRHSMLSVFQI